MTPLERLLRRSVKMSSIDEAKLTQRKVMLEDCLSLVTEIEKETRSRLDKHDIVTAIGASIILVSLVSDCIRDTAGVTAAATNPLMKIGLEEVYDKARDQKWTGNKYEKLIELINKNTSYLEKINDAYNGKDKNLIAMFISVQKNIATTAVGLAGFSEDAADAKVALRRSLASLKTQIEKLQKQLSTTNFYLQTGQGPETNAPRMTPIQTPVGLM